MYWNDALKQIYYILQLQALNFSRLLISNWTHIYKYINKQIYFMIFY